MEKTVKKRTDLIRFFKCVERAKGIEPSYKAWEAFVLPLNYARTGSQLCPIFALLVS